MSDEAKQFLQTFVQRLGSMEQAMREQTQVQRVHVQQQQQIMTMLSTISAQLDGMAQRSDYLYEQMGRLGYAMSGGAEPPPPATALPPGEFSPPGIDGVLRSAGREIVDDMVDGFFPRGSGRRRRRG